MNILALDTATRTGWAIGTVTDGIGQPLTSGVADFSIRTKATKTIPADHSGKRFAWYRDWLREHLRINKIDLVVYESVVGGARAGGKTSLVQKGLEAFTYEMAFRMGAPVWSFSAATIKKWATNDGRLTHESKAELVRLAAHKWHHSTLCPHKPTKSQPWSYDDNQCDALWLLDLTLAAWCHLRDHTKGTPALERQSDELTRIANRITLAKWSPAKNR